MSAVTFNNAVEPRSDLELLRRSLESRHKGRFEPQIKSLRSYVFNKDGSWLLQDAQFVEFVREVISEAEVIDDKVKLVRILAFCANRPDLVSMFTADSKDMRILKVSDKWLNMLLK